MEVAGGGRGDEGRGVGVVFSRLILCLSWADSESGGGTGLTLGDWWGREGGRERGRDGDSGRSGVSVYALS